MTRRVTLTIHETHYGRAVAIDGARIGTHDPQGAPVVATITVDRAALLRALGMLPGLDGGGPGA